METKDITMLLDDIRSVWDKDHPQSAVAKFNEACELYINNSDYKGLLVFFKHCLPMSEMLEESMTSIIDQEENKIYESGKEPLRSLFIMMKGLAFKQTRYWHDNLKEVFSQALAHPEDLEVPISDFDWFVSSDECSLIYDKNNNPVMGHNLLSYIGCQTKRFDLLAQYYEQIGNSDATCVARCLDMIGNYKGDEEDFLNLVEEYNDSPVSVYAIEGLVERHMSRFQYEELDDRNLLIEKIVKQLHFLLQQFPDWLDIKTATELLEKLAVPEAKIRMDKTVVLPNKICSVTLEKKNIKHVTVSIYPTTLGARKGYHNIHFERVERSFNEVPVFQKDYDFDVKDKEYWRLSDIEIGPFSPGLYKMVIIGDGKICFATMIQVSNLCLLVEPLPKNKKRIAVLNAETGLPVPFAGINIRKKADKNVILKCDEKGEIIWDSSCMDVSLYPFQGPDQWSEAVLLRDWDSYEYDKMKPRNSGDILTDRSIYRPGQTVHITVVRYNVNESNQVKTMQQENLGITLTKGYGREVIWNKKIKTDDYGIAQTELTLPEYLEPGHYSLRAGDGPSTCIEIEEYKRPTFKVKLEPYTQPYKMGDTIIIKGKATSFAGIPIANAKVNFETYAEMSLWFYRLSLYWGMGRYTYRSLEECESSGSTITDQNGNFQIEVPLQISNNELKEKSLFLDVTAHVDVVDLNGETQSDSITLPPDFVNATPGFQSRLKSSSKRGCIAL